MSLVTFDFSKVNPSVHRAMVLHMIAHGYKLEEPLSIPSLYDFNIPESATINSIRDNIPMSGFCRDNLTDDNFSRLVPITRGIQVCGFYDMKDSFSSQEAVGVINKLSQQTGRDFRVGAPLEALSFWLSNRSNCPRWFTVLGKVYKGKVLHWNHDLLEFHLGDWDSGWCSFRQVFIVEDL
jgi:hypothetical protein